MSPIFDFAFQEQRLLWRSWGTRLAALFCLLVILSQHPAFDRSLMDYNLDQLAGTWSDRAALLGTLLALMVAPFSLDRLVRSRIASLELAKPFQEWIYISARLMGITLTVFSVLSVSGLLHLTISFVVRPEADLIGLITAYLRYALLIVAPPVFLSISMTFFFSLFLHPLLVVPAFLAYLITTTLTSSAAASGFSWIAPLVRPEYYHSQIPAEILPFALVHQVVFLVIGLGLWMVSPRLFKRKRFLMDHPLTNKNLSPRIDPLFHLLARIPASWRRIWGVPFLAAAGWALIAPSASLDPHPRFPFLAQDSAFLCLEFYLSLSGLFLLAGGAGNDGRAKTIDLLLARPVNRWRLLAERLAPGLTGFILIVVALTAFLHLSYTPLPLVKALLVSITTGLYLGMVGLTVSNLTHNALAGIGAGFIFWLFEAGFQGRLTAPFFLLVVSHQPAIGEAGNFWRNPGLWLPAKLGLLALSMLLFWANGWLIDRGKARRKALGWLSIGLPLMYGLGWWLIPMLLCGAGS